MPDTYYSDRNDPPIPQDKESITPKAWAGVVSVVESALSNGSLAKAFPVRDCYNYTGAGDGPITGVNRQMLFSAVQAHIPRLPSASYSHMEYRLTPDHVPDMSAMLDLIEFIGARIHRISREGSCSQNRRDVHYEFAEFIPTGQSITWGDVFVGRPELPPGQADFREAIETIFRRQGLAFTLGRDMRVQRLGPPEARPLLSDFHPQTEDQVLNELLTEATTRFLSPDPQERNRALQVLWNAYERTKTLHCPEMDKKASANKLLDEASGGSEELFQQLDQEFRALTKIGNEFRIRHHELDKHELPNSMTVDYLFTRMLSVLAFVLRSSERMAA